MDFICFHQTMKSTTVTVGQSNAEQIFRQNKSKTRHPSKTGLLLPMGWRWEWHLWHLKPENAEIYVAGCRHISRRSGLSKEKRAAEMMREFPNAPQMPERWGHPDTTMQMQLFWSHGPRAHIKITPLGVWLRSSLAASNCCWITIRPPKAPEGQMFPWQIWGPVLIIRFNLMRFLTQKRSHIQRPSVQFFPLTCKKACWSCPSMGYLDGQSRPAQSNATTGHTTWHTLQM